MVRLRGLDAPYLHQLSYRFLGDSSQSRRGNQQDAPAEMDPSQALPRGPAKVSTPMKMNGGRCEGAWRELKVGAFGSYSPPA